MPVTKLPHHARRPLIPSVVRPVGGWGKWLERRCDTAIFRTVDAVLSVIRVLRVRESDFAPGEQWMKYAYYLAYVVLGFLVAFFVHWFGWGKGSR